MSCALPASIATRALGSQTPITKLQAWSLQKTEPMPQQNVCCVGPGSDVDLGLQPLGKFLLHFSYVYRSSTGKKKQNT